jgi:CheY-like chemotaxis protein
MTFDARARVLIADGNPEFRLRLDKRLLARDIVSDTVADGDKAIEKLTTNQYAVVVVDLLLQQVAAERILEIIDDQPCEERPVVLVVAPPGSARSLDVDVVQIVLRRTCGLRQLADMIQSCVRIATAEPGPPTDSVEFKPAA